MSSAKDKIRYIIDVIDEQLGLLPEGDRGFQVSRYTLMGGMFLDFDEIDSIIRKLNTDDWGLSINLMSKSSDSRSLDIYRVSLVDDVCFSRKKRSFFEANKPQSPKESELVAYKDENITIAFRDKNIFVNGEKIHNFYEASNPFKLWNFGLENSTMKVPYTAYESLGLSSAEVSSTLSSNHDLELYNKIKTYCDDNNLSLPKNFRDNLLWYDSSGAYLFKIRK